MFGAELGVGVTLPLVGRLKQNLLGNIIVA